MDEKNQVDIDQCQTNKTRKKHKSNLQLLRIRVISASDFPSNISSPTPARHNQLKNERTVGIPKSNSSIEAIYSSPSGDTFMCPLSNGQIKALTLNSIQFEIGPTTYFHSLQAKVDGEDCSAGNSVTDIAFSPFVKAIFLVSWNSGEFALFHQSEAFASITWDIWNYMELVENIKSQKALDDSIVSIRWSKSKPCVFFVLTLQSIIVFDLLQGRHPYRSEKIVHPAFGESPNIIPLGLITGFSKKSLPRLVMTNALQREVLSIELNFRLFDGRPPSGTKDEIDALRKLVISKAFI